VKMVNTFDIVNFLKKRINPIKYISGPEEVSLFSIWVIKHFFVDRNFSEG
jgi:hypothetical protein